MEEKLGDLQLTVFDLIRLAGWEGKTCDEMEAETGLTHQSCSARVNELANWEENGKKKPFIERRGITRKTRAGRGAGVYVLAGLMPANARVHDDAE